MSSLRGPNINKKIQWLDIKLIEKKTVDTQKNTDRQAEETKI